ncbi:phage head-tail joining protein [Agrobacterium pusense]|uniref:phage head-tail joining protein n=1 Tax=Agrobacterium pusense TaxID=648995 RepID=UPI000D1B1037|nr:hypothetical protein [Agrobacterium pusense]
MASLTELRAYRERLAAARYSGTSSVRDSNGESVEYKSDAEMAAALRALELEIAWALSRPQPVIYPSVCKGL